MKNRIILIATILLAWMNGQLSAQDLDHPVRRAHNPERMASCLSLSEEQQESIQIIHDRFIEEKDNLLAKEGLSPDVRRNEMRALHENRNKQIREVLTAEQLQEFHRSNPSEKRRMNQRMGVNDGLHALLLEKRREFDPLLSEEEQKIINTLRAELPDHPRATRAARKDHRGEMLENRIEEVNKIHERMRVLDPVVENHRSELESIRQAIDKEIKGGRVERPAFQRGQKPGRFEGAEFMRERRFLMMDPELEDALQSDREQNDGLLLFPNPAKDKLNLEFETFKQEVASVELLDKNGAVIQVIDAINCMPGVQRQTLDVSQLNKGELYYIRIQLDDTIFARKFIKL